jgi:hypothetical protein
VMSALGQKRPRIARGLASTGIELSQTTPKITAALNSKRRITFPPSTSGGVG